MRRIWHGIALLLGLLSVFNRLSAQEAALKIDEDHIRLRLLPSPQLELPFINSTDHLLEGAFLLEMLDRGGGVVTSKQGSFRAAPGSMTEKVAWEPAKLPSDSPSELGWLRLRYTITPKTAPEFAPVRGVVQMGRLITDAFELRMTGAAAAAFGTKYPVRLRVNSPGTGRPYSGVPVVLQLSIDDDDDHSIRKTVTTDGSGYAVTAFELPANLSANKGEITATATRGFLHEEESIRFDFLKQPSLTITTDKPLYQPGQTLHMRLLAFGFDKQAWQGANIELSIQDSDGQEAYRTTVATSRLGVATAEWDIPLKLQLDEYSIRAMIPDPKEQYTVYAGSRVRISRYELPEFTVKAKPDRSYYLPGQDARIEVSADYLFGKPVQRAKVRVVRQESRNWNVKEQKWETEESAAVEGELDAAGKFVALFPLGESFEDFEESRYQRYRDVGLAAYMTDLSTGRTEQRRLKLRLTHQPIHLYLTPQSSLSTEQPLLIYVTSSYADGTPASVTGTIEAARPNNAGEFDDRPDTAHRVPIGKFHTNRLGVARVELPPMPENLLIVAGGYISYDVPWRTDESEPNRRKAEIVLHAADAKALQGEYAEDIELARGGNYVSVRTDRTLYHSGEAIAVTIRSNIRAREIVADIVSEDGMLASQLVRLDHGRAEINVPSDGRFHGEIAIIAHAMTGEADRDREFVASATVIYPAPQELRVDARMTKTIFRPGENASVQVHVNLPGGKSTESALGVLVFDRAVAERVRDDEQFGRDYGFSIFDYYDGYRSSIGGITYRDLVNLDPGKPFTADLDLAAELLSRSASWMTGTVLKGGIADYAMQAGGYFNVDKDERIKHVEQVLDKIYAASGDYPKTESEFRATLKAAGIDPDAVCDPWDLPYRPVFSTSGVYTILSLVSNGVDKRAHTADDFIAKNFSWRYFRKAGEAISGALNRYHEDTGEYIRDYPTLRREMTKQHIDLDSLRDPWGTPYAYSFPISGPYFQVKVDSAGPDKGFDGEEHRSRDDVHEWTSYIHYFQQQTEALNRALAEHFATTAKFPQSQDELAPLLQAAKLAPERLLDPWGNPYHFTFDTESRYWDRIEVHNYSQYQYQGQPHKTTEVTPVTQKMAYIRVTSYGPENKPDAAFPVAEFSRVVAEMSSTAIRAMATPKEPPLPGGKGGISGSVIDPQGAVIQGVSVLATSADTGQQFTTSTDSAGAFVFAGIPTGTYRLQFIKAGFRVAVVLQVPVENGASTRVDTSLAVGGSNETVEVSAEAPAVATTMAQVSSKSERQPGTPAEAANKQLFTPRLRQYFPETLLWRPEIVTDEKGNASFTFPMADNITAWKMSIVASTRQGKVGIAEKELRTFQPFFIVHDPPPVLTEGDRISLPVVLRNYSGKSQTIEAALQPQAWFSILSTPKQRITVAANTDASAVFSFRALSSTKTGAQRVSATNAETGDAVERQIAVHPDGQQVSFTVAKVLGPPDDFMDFDIPAVAVRGSAEAELRIYPNLISHMLDALRGLAGRPSGCYEQMTSIGYANLLLLQALKKTGQETADSGDSRGSVAAGAKERLQEAYLLLTQAQKEDGSFPYWKNWVSDVALTAYVLRFMTRAGEFIHVDENAIAKAREYLLAQQSKSGAWRTYDWRQEKMVDSPNLSAYVARALASAGAGADDKESRQAKESLALAMNYLEMQIDSWSDAYLVGNYAIAAVTSGQKDRIARAQSALAPLAHTEGATTYWNLEANTSPFYGWGQAGRLETTALAVEALTLFHAQSADGDLRDINRGLQYLLSHKDRYAMWYSTQATQNVIEAILAALPQHLESGSASDATIAVNGNKISTIKLPSAQTITGPIVLELDQRLANGRNHLQVVGPGNSSLMNTVLLASYYVSPRDSTSTTQENLARGDKRALLLKVHFDRTELDLKDVVSCQVAAERIGFRGYGMMMADVGLPPGADVDRASLEKAKEAGSIDAYEVKPDKVTFYLWPAAGGTQFAFQFRSRMRMEAMSGPSLLYDYYNPEAAATVSPVRFVVH